LDNIVGISAILVGLNAVFGGKSELPIKGGSIFGNQGPLSITYPDSLSEAFVSRSFRS